MAKKRSTWLFASALVGGTNTDQPHRASESRLLLSSSRPYGCTPCNWRDRTDELCPHWMQKWSIAIQRHKPAFAKKGKLWRLPRRLC